MVRRYSSSGGSCKEMLLLKTQRRRAADKSSENDDDDDDEDEEKLARLFQSLLQWRDQTGRTLMHTQDLALTAAFLLRLRQFRQHQTRQAQQQRTSLLKQWLTVRDHESGYTPLHWAAYRRDLALILLLLRHAASADDNDDGVVRDDSTATALVPPQRLKQRPMELLLNGGTSATTNINTIALDPNSCVTAMVQAVDFEGMTAGDLLSSLSRNDLLACRLALPRPKVKIEGNHTSHNGGGNQRRNSFDINDPDEEEDEQNEFDLLRRSVRLLQQGRQQQARVEEEEQHACEVFTFGRAHHCALGIGQESKSSLDEVSNKKQVRPRRVQAFALGEVRRCNENTMDENNNSGSAVAVAGAAHHTLVATSSGHLYAFGLGKGGRLGTGSEQHCPLPTRIRGALSSRRVVAIAASENHSLCVDDSGMVFAWGSNRFGQLGIPSNGSTDNSTSDGSSSRCLPRRVDDLKHVFCVGVAAGVKHSVALSRRGEVYTWGNNAAGQLGNNNNRTSGAAHKVQRVEALWGNNHTQPKVAIAVAVSDQATLVLTIPNTSAGGLPFNSIYSWGHGSHIPTKVHFDTTTTTRGNTGTSSSNRMTINPIAIACARYHNVTVTSDGLVYTWGLHAEPLGTATEDKRRSGGSGSATASSPQLVTGMLPENGGGIAVGVSASENHTAIITDAGALFTWGATYGKNILGHEGVRWQPDPKRVPGVTRAVGVAAAKEHTILLIATTFPPLPPADDSASLELLAARKVAEHVDLFNALPCLISAERTHCSQLIDYCTDFVIRNLDGVLTVGQKSVMDCYLNEQLTGCQFPSDDKRRDRRQHPILMDIILAGTTGRPAFGRDPFSYGQSWFQACQKIASSNEAKLLTECCLLSRNGSGSDLRGKRTLSCSETSQGVPESRNGRACSNRCFELTANMDLSSIELAEAKHACLSKELRGVRKRLSQINKLQVDPTTSPFGLSSEQQEKISRRPQLEADLLLFEPALANVEQCLRDLCIRKEKAGAVNDPMGGDIKVSTESKNGCQGDPTRRVSFRCDTCQITCPDEKSHALHMSGRKHRNRVAHVEEKEKKSVASSFMAEMQAKQLLGQTAPLPTRSVKFAPGPWHKMDTNPDPPYRLPAPSVPVADSVVTNSKGPLSLREIMLEESEKGIRKKGKQQSPLLLPKGSAPSIKSPPWSSSPVATVNLARVSTTSSSSVKGSGKGKPQSLLLLPKGSASSLMSPPWASSPVVLVSAVPESTPCRASSLGDFIPPTSCTPKKNPPFSAASPTKAWCTPAAAITISPAPATPNTVTLVDIQQEEKELKSRQDQAVREDGKWYVERRERAASLKDIQTRDEKEREERIFIEEQYRIEKQIEQERIASSQAKQKASAKRRSSQRNRNRKSKTGKKPPPSKKDQTT